MAAQQVQSVNVCDWIQQLHQETQEQTLTLRAPLVQGQQMVAEDLPYQFVNCNVEVPKRYVQHHVLYNIEARSVILEEDGEGNIQESNEIQPMTTSVLVGTWLLRTIRSEHDQFTRAQPFPSFAVHMRRNHSTVNIKLRFPLDSEWYKRVVVVNISTLFVPNFMLSQVNGCHLWLQHADPTVPSLHFYHGNCYIEEDPEQTPEDVFHQIAGHQHMQQQQQPPPQYYRGRGGSARGGRGGGGGRGRFQHKTARPMWGDQE